MLMQTCCNPHIYTLPTAARRFGVNQPATTTKTKSSRLSFSFIHKEVFIKNNLSSRHRGESGGEAGFVARSIHRPQPASNTSAAERHKQDGGCAIKKTNIFVEQFTTCSATRRQANVGSQLTRSWLIYAPVLTRERREKREKRRPHACSHFCC